MNTQHPAIDIDKAQAHAMRLTDKLSHIKLLSNVSPSFFQTQQKALSAALEFLMSDDVSAPLDSRVTALEGLIDTIHHHDQHGKFDAPDHWVRAYFDLPFYFDLISSRRRRVQTGFRQNASFV